MNHLTLEAGVLRWRSDLFIEPTDAGLAALPESGTIEVTPKGLHAIRTQVPARPSRRVAQDRAATWDVDPPFSED